MTNRGDQPAYSNTYKNNDGTLDYESGMTIREKIAAQCLAGILSNPDKSMNHWGYDEFAMSAVRSADALIVELSKPTEK